MACPSCKPIPFVPGSANPYISCLDCGLRTDYHTATKVGWTYDTDGPPYLAYFCSRCSKKHDPENQDEAI